MRFKIKLLWVPKARRWDIIDKNNDSMFDFKEPGLFQRLVIWIVRKFGGFPDCGNMKKYFERLSRGKRGNIYSVNIKKVKNGRSRKRRHSVKE